METLLDRSELPGFSAEGYFDDLTVHHEWDWRIVWRDTVEVIRLLSEEGIMINLKKCRFLTRWLQLLGCTVYHGGY